MISIKNTFTYRQLDSFTMYPMLELTRVLARIPNLAVKICLLVSSRVCVGVVGQKHVVWDVGAIFCFTDLHFNLVILRHTVFSKGQGIKIYDIDKLNSI